jgi:hypothetical protein
MRTFRVATLTALWIALMAGTAGAADLLLPRRELLKKVSLVSDAAAPVNVDATVDLPLLPAHLPAPPAD